jgi:predicted ABC-type ATPase
MAIRRARLPKCIVIGGPYGAGKTIFAREILPRGRGVLNVVNADLIAAGLSPLRLALAARAAGRLVLAELDRLATARQNFAFEARNTARIYGTPVYFEKNGKIVAEKP